MKHFLTFSLIVIILANASSTIAGERELSISHSFEDSDKKISISLPCVDNETNNLKLNKYDMIGQKTAKTNQNESLEITFIDQIPEILFYKILRGGEHLNFSSNRILAFENITYSLSNETNIVYNKLNSTVPIFNNYEGKINVSFIGRDSQDNEYADFIMLDYDRKAPGYEITHLEENIIDNKTIQREIRNNSSYLKNVVTPQTINVTITDQYFIATSSITLFLYDQLNNTNKTVFVAGSKCGPLPHSIYIGYNISWGKLELDLTDFYNQRRDSVILDFIYSEQIIQNNNTSQLTNFNESEKYTQNLNFELSFVVFLLALVKLRERKKP